MQREPIYAALFDRLKTSIGGKAKTISRAAQHYDDVPPAQQPAVFMVEKTESATRTRNLPPKWTINCELLVYVNSSTPQAALVSTVINSILDAIDAALAPPPTTMNIDLGGLVEHAWIEGDVEIYEGILQGNKQSVVIVPIRALVAG